MSYELIGESIKSAISIKLGQIFRVATNQVNQQGQIVYTYPIRYKENVTNQQYPNFHIVQVNSNITPQLNIRQSSLNNPIDRVQIDYLMNIQYRLAQDTEQITNLRQQLDAIGFKLLTEFRYIDLEKPVFTKECRYEITDGILQFFCNITVYATNENTNDDLMQELDINENLEEEE